MSPIVPARRVGTVKEYYFSTKLKEIERLRQSGVDVVSLGVGGPDRAPHPDVTLTLQQAAAAPGANGYQPYTGLPALRAAYAEWYRRHYGVELDPDSEVLPLIGSKEGILHTTLALVNPGDGVLVPNPGYPTYTSVSRLAEARIHYYPLTQAGDWEPDFEALERTDLSDVKLMWVNYPHMPTGHAASRALFERLIDFGHRHGIVIVNDNPYSFILNDQPLSILSVDGAREIAIEMNSLSKSHNMPGWRMGMLASNATMVNWVLKVKSNIDSGQFKPMMEAAVRALRCDDDWYDRLNAVYRRRRVIAEQVMTAMRCTFDPRQRGLFLWGRIADDEVDAAHVADRVLERARVFVVPGFIFGSEGERYIRLSLCADETRLTEALRRIQAMNTTHSQ